jgi:hypothetical protein
MFEVMWFRPRGFGVAGMPCGIYVVKPAKCVIAKLGSLSSY